MPDAGDQCVGVTELEAWRQNISYFHFLKSDMILEIVNPFFLNILCHLQWETLSDFNAISVNLHSRQDSKVLPACWILIGQFQFQAPQQHARNRSHEKPIRKFLHPITIAKWLSQTWEKRFIQQGSYTFPRKKFKDFSKTFQDLS